MRALAPFSAALMLAVASPVVAQTAPSAPETGLRYLAWPGKPAGAARTEGLRPAHDRSPINAPAGPANLIGRTMATPAPAPAPARIAGAALPPARAGLTPASDWLRPAHLAPGDSSPAPLPPALSPDLGPHAASQPAAEAETPVPAAAVPQVSASATAASVTPPPSPTDPRAPRRDAPIFRIQPQSASAPAALSAGPAVISAATSAAPAGQGARYYSLHRQNGRQPDAIPQTQPVYLDGLPVELTQPPSSADLAQPPEPPALIRNAQGRLQAAPASLPDDLP